MSSGRNEAIKIMKEKIKAEENITDEEITEKITNLLMLGWEVEDKIVENSEELIEEITNLLQLKEEADDDNIHATLRQLEEKSKIELAILLILITRVLNLKKNRLENFRKLSIEELDLKIAQTDYKTLCEEADKEIKISDKIATLKNFCCRNDIDLKLNRNKLKNPELRAEYTSFISEHYHIFYTCHNVNYKKEMKELDSLISKASTEYLLKIEPHNVASETPTPTPTVTPTTTQIDDSHSGQNIITSTASMMSTLSISTTRPLTTNILSEEKPSLLSCYQQPTLTNIEADFIEPIDKKEAVTEETPSCFKKLCCRIL